uniref:Nitrate/chlorate transporter n=1 Tax=Aegilops tauschii TaxID=37682 RepID=M8C004_AEGTA
MGSVLPEIAAEGKGILTDAWDSKGRPAARSTTGGWGCAAMILGAELFERMTTLGIAVNLVPYMTGTMHLGSAAAANTVTNFIGTSFMLCLLGGFVADTYLGRYLTIAVFSAVQATGVMVLTISTVAPGLRPAVCGDATGQSPDCVPANGTQLGVLYLGLYMTALGTGGLKSSVSGFGSDQFDESDDGERKKMMRFFNWFYFFVSIGALLAVTVLRVFVGLFLSIVGMAAAAIVERHRLTSSTHGVTLTVFLLMPQFLLVGAGEAFTYMGQLDFFLRECPKGMKTMSTGLFLSTCALGFFFSTVTVTIVHKVTGHGPRGTGGWLADNLDQGRLDYFYWLLAVMSAINIVFFTIAARGYVYKEKRLADAGIELADEEAMIVGH